MLDVLEKFQADVNTNTHVQRVVKGWNTEVLLEQSDRTENFHLLIKDGKIEQIISGSADLGDEAPMKIVGEAAIMRGLFDGKINGIRANNEGLIAIYGAMSDQVKLDAIALILWGI